MARTRKALTGAASRGQLAQKTPHDHISAMKKKLEALKLVAAAAGRVHKTRKPRRRRISSITDREIKKLQKDPKATMIPKTKFEKLVREIAANFKDDVRFSKQAIPTLQEGAHALLNDIYGNGLEIMKRSSRKTFDVEDMLLAIKLTNVVPGYKRVTEPKKVDEEESKKTPPKKRKKTPPKKLDDVTDAADIDSLLK
jgi:histone H3